MSETRSWRLAAIGVLAATLLVLGPICSHDFLWWDDHGTIHQNQWLNPPTLRSIVHYWTAPQWGLYMPVTTSIWTVIASVAHVQPDPLGIALNPWFFHAASVITHAIAALLVLRIFRLLNATPGAAVCGALLFAIHPIQIESVAWASGLKDVLAGMFSFAAIVQYIQFALAKEQNQPWVKRFIAATIFLLLAMLSKASAMTLPLIVVVIDHWGIGRRWRDALPVACAWLILVVPIALYAIAVQDAENTPRVAVALRPLIAFDALAFYIQKLLWPVRLCVDYGRTPAVVIAHGWLWWDWVVPVAIGVAAVLYRRRAPILLLSAVVFVAGCLHTLGFTRTLYQYFTTTADHYLYCSMLAPALALAWALSVRPKFPAFAIIGLLLILLSWRSTVQQSYWQNDISLFTRCIEVNPRSYVSYENLGSAYARQGDYETAVRLFKAAIDINPKYALSYSNLGHALAKTGDTAGAISADQSAIDLQTQSPSLRPSWVRDNWQVGELLLQQKQYARAEAYLLTAAQSDPHNNPLLAMLAEAHHSATQPSTAPLRSLQR